MILRLREFPVLGIFVTEKLLIGLEMNFPWFRFLLWFYFINNSFVQIFLHVNFLATADTSECVIPILRELN